jgi:hypothetical protein
MEHEVSGSGSVNVNDHGYDDSDRWSSSADPGGSRPLGLPMPVQIHPYSSRPTSPPIAGSSGSGFGLSFLTSAFRKSVSASSITSVGSKSTEPRSQLHHYPSLVSMGATSWTGSRTGTYYTAHSDVGVDEGGNRLSGPPGTAVGNGAVNTPIAKTKGTGSLSLSTSTVLNNSVDANTAPVPSLPLLPVSHTLPQPQGPNHSRPNDTNTTLRGSNARAHLRTPAAHRVRADPHLARAGGSTHGVIDLAER